MNTSGTPGVNVLQSADSPVIKTHSCPCGGYSTWKLFLESLLRSVMRMDREVHVKSVSLVTLMHSAKQLRHFRSYVINSRGNPEM